MVQVEEEPPPWGREAPVCVTIELLKKRKKVPDTKKNTSRKIGFLTKQKKVPGGQEEQGAGEQEEGRPWGALAGALASVFVLLYS